MSIEKYRAFLHKGSVWIFCPGCKQHHALAVAEPNPLGARWDFNGDFKNPTFSPSLLCNGSYPEIRCHSFIKDGNIQFLGDCYHELANQTVPLPEIEAW